MTDQFLAGRTAFITGASSGLGRHFAHLLAGFGARVALAARRTDRLDAEVAAIRSAGGGAVAIALDVEDAEAIGLAMDRAEAELGRISILLNNAGVSGEGAALSLPVDRFDQTFDVNVRGVYFAAREAAKRMIDSGVAERGEARIVQHRLHRRIDATARPDRLLRLQGGRHLPDPGSGPRVGEAPTSPSTPSLPAISRPRSTPTGLRRRQARPRSTASRAAA